MDSDDDLSRIDALELAVLQLANAVELAVTATQGGVDGVLEQVGHVRRLLGEKEEEE